MEEIILNVSDILRTGDNTRYRIIYVTEVYAALFQMDITKFHLITYAVDDIVKNIQDGQWKIEKDAGTKVVDESMLNENMKNRFEVYRACINEVSKVYGPSYCELTQKKGKTELKEILKKFGISKQVFWPKMIDYLASGCRESALLDKRVWAQHNSGERQYTKRTGRHTEEGQGSDVILDDVLRSRFEEALQDYKKGRAKSYKGCYEDMLKKYYRKKTVKDNAVIWELLPPEEIPTYRQFYNYALKHITKEEKDEIKTSKQEQRNNLRLLLSDSMKGVKGPGDMVEIDALEADVSLVSERNHEQAIGRGVLYLMTDVWTRVILAMSVSFENNSTLAITNLLLNLVDDKQEYVKNFGITSFSRELWPSNIIPRRMRVDRGADFRSDKLKQILNQIGIERLLEPAATGSLKGIVEQEFRQIQFNQNDIFENNGLIEKRHDSEHHREAQMTIREYTASCINFVLSHNQKYLDYYKLNRDMHDAGVMPVPIKLWEYGCRKYGSPRPIADKDGFLWKLLTPTKVSLSRMGIIWKGLYYMNYKDEDLRHRMYELGTSREKEEMRYDPRDIGKLYYLKNGILMEAALNPDKFGNAGFEHITYADYMDYKKEKKKMDAEGRHHNLNIAINERTINKMIVDSIDAPRYSEEKDMKPERKEEKNRVNRENSVSKRIKKAVPELTDKKEEKPDVSKIQDKEMVSDEDSDIMAVLNDDSDDDFINALKNK